MPTTARKRSGRTQRRGPRDDRAPVVADDHRLLLAERVAQAEHVADQVEDRVAVDLRRLVALPVAAHVGRDRVIARGGERGQLVAPRVPGLGPAVAQQHERAFARFGDVQLDSVGRDRAVADLGHRLAGYHAGPSDFRHAGRPRREAARELGRHRRERAHPLHRGAALLRDRRARPDAPAVRRHRRPAATGRSRCRACTSRPTSSSRSATRTSSRAARASPTWATSSVTYRFEISDAAGQLAIEGRIVAVATDLEGRKTDLPDPLRKALESAL